MLHIVRFIKSLVSGQPAYPSGPDMTVENIVGFIEQSLTERLSELYLQFRALGDGSQTRVHQLFSINMAIIAKIKDMLDNTTFRPIIDLFYYRFTHVTDTELVINLNDARSWIGTAYSEVKEHQWYVSQQGQYTIARPSMLSNPFGPKHVMMTTGAFRKFCELHETYGPVWKYFELLDNLLFHTQLLCDDAFMVQYVAPVTGDNLAMSILMPLPMGGSLIEGSHA